MLDFYRSLLIFLEFYIFLLRVKADRLFTGRQCSLCKAAVVFALACPGYQAIGAIRSAHAVNVH